MAFINLEETKLSLKDVIIAISFAFTVGIFYQQTNQQREKIETLEKEISELHKDIDNTNLVVYEKIEKIYRLLLEK